MLLLQNVTWTGDQNASVTCIIEAASSGGSHPPHPLVLVLVPVAHVITLQCVWGQVTDLQLGELPDEV